MTHRIRNIAVAVGLALVAMILTFAYVTNYERSVNHAQSQVQVYVAAHDLASGTAGSELRGGHGLRAVSVSRNMVVPGAISNPQQLQSLLVTTPIYTGEQVTLRQFANVASEGIRGQLKGTLRAVQVAGDPNQLLVGTLQTGDHVDVVANLHTTAATTGASTGETRIVLRDLDVLDVSDGSETPQVTPASQQPFVIVSVTGKQALALFYVMKNADWTLALRPPTGATDSPGQTDTLKTLLGGGSR
jgi:Flp pilus assembly protein CpaB